MLGKLFRYELRATGRVMLPCFALVLVLAGLTRLSAAYLIDAGGLLSFLGGLIIFLFAIACIGLWVLILVLTIQRFRTNLLGDEGYLMHALPVKTSANIFAKLLGSLIWYFAAAVVAVLAVVVLTFHFGALDGFFSSIKDLLARLTPGYAANGFFWIVEFLLLVAIALSAFALEIYASLSLGYRANARKTMWSFLCFCGIWIAVQFVGGGLVLLLNKAAVVSEVGAKLEILLFNSLPLSLSAEAFVHVAMVGGILVGILYCAVLYWITAANLKNHLNLE